MNKTDFKANGSVLTVTRAFDAPLSLVWSAWTEAELLDQWWAPAPWKSETSYMNFQEGDYRLYAMVSPDGEKHWGRTDYRSITTHEDFTGQDAFCNEDGQVNAAFPVATFSNHFSEGDGKTRVMMVTTYPSEEQLSQILAMGMKEGLSAAFDNLDHLLDSI
jgi:PhnB protein